VILRKKKEKRWRLTLLQGPLPREKEKKRKKLKCQIWGRKKGGEEGRVFAVRVGWMSPTGKSGGEGRKRR